MKNKRFVITVQNAMKVAGVPKRKLQTTFPKASKIVGRTLYKTADLKAAFPATYNDDHHHLTYSKLSEFIRDHLLALFKQNPTAMQVGFHRNHLKAKSRYTERQINMAIWLYPAYFYVEKQHIMLRQDAPDPVQKIKTCGKRPQHLAQAEQAKLPTQRLVPIKPPQVPSADIPPRMRNPWEEFIILVRRKKPLISMWFDHVEFKQTSLVTAQLTVDERDSLCAEFIQQRDLIPWMESRFAELGFPMSLEVVIKRVRKQAPEPAKPSERVIVALPEKPKQKQPKKGLIASALAAFRKFIEKVVLP
jgi:hypothetical protein